MLSKDELLEKVWAGQFVEENNLTVHVSALRKALGETKNEHRFIVTVPGKGYSFVAKVNLGQITEAAQNTEKQVETADSNSNISNPNKLIVRQTEENLSASVHGQNALPLLVPGDFGKSELLIGRTREIAEIRNLLRRGGANLVTLPGTGGTGKTSLARAVADELTTDFSDSVFFIELAAVTNAKLVVPAIANTLGVKETGDKSLIDVLKNFLRERRILLVLDNFEQLISAAPSLKELLASVLFLKILIGQRTANKLSFPIQLQRGTLFFFQSNCFSFKVKRQK